MSKMKTYLLLVFLLKGVLFLTPTFSSSNSSYGIINKEDDLLILNSNDKVKELKIYKKNNQNNSYSLNITKNLKEFPSNITKDLDLDFIYHVVNENEIVYFNEDFYSSYYFNKSAKFSSGEFTPSFLGKDLFIIPTKDITLSHNINIIKFDYKNNTQKFNQLKSYIFMNIIPVKLFKYIDCTSINNTIICGYIYITKIDINDGISYALSTFNSNNTKIQNNILFEYKLNIDKTIYLKTIALNENILFFINIDNNQLVCILAKSINNKEIVFLKNQTIFNSFELDKINTQDSCSYIILNNNEIILSCKGGWYFSSYIQITKLTINNNEINTKIHYLNINDYFNIKYSYSFNLLKDSNDNLILFINYEDPESNKRQYGFHYFGYSSCKDIKQVIFNGEKTQFNFTTKIIPLLNINQNYDSNILFFFNDTELKSLITNNSEVIKSNISYSKNDLYYFYLNKDNYEYTINNKGYSVIYSSTNDEFKSQKCYLNLSFNTCDEKCELCSSKGECFDRNWNIVIDKSNYFIIF